MNITPLTGADDLTELLHAATHLDVTSRGRSTVSETTRTAVRDAHPRTGLRSCFGNAFRHEYHHETTHTCGGLVADRNISGSAHERTGTMIFTDAIARQIANGQVRVVYRRGGRQHV